MTLPSIEQHEKEIAGNQLQTYDMQGLIVRGYKTLTAATYLLLEITDAAAAREFIIFLLSKKIITTGISGKREQKGNNDPVEAVNIAFTNSGIEKLLGKNVLDTFSREFIEGMSVRQNPYSQSATETPAPEERGILLGDMGGNHPDNWRWGSQQKPVDVMLMVFAKDKTALDVLLGKIDCEKQQGVRIVYEADTWQYDPNNIKEHFGFTDGISQPFIRGLSKASETNDEDMLINPGEFILGYHNEYNHFSPSPFVNAEIAQGRLQWHPVHKDKRDLGLNGTYLVFRQMDQYVEKFWDHLYKESKEPVKNKTDQVKMLAAKMVGRWPDGRPLVQAPFDTCPVSDKTLNNFRYAQNDENGVKCPFGAHIRRSNPRDQVHAGRNKKDSLELSKKHRMLRRGRIYGEPLDKDFNIDNMINHIKAKKIINGNEWDSITTTPVTTGNGKEKENTRRGLHFICLVSDIARQFEFVQNVWSNTSTFAGLCNEVDPIISPRPTTTQPECHEFTTPQETVRNRYLKVPEFTSVVGGAYFFMPGMNALRYIVNYSADNEPPDSLMKHKSPTMIPEEMTSGCPMANLNDVSQKVITYIRGILKKKYGENPPKRAFHTKTIGLVQATVKVDEGLPADMRVGLFKEEKEYKAWIRFSNANPGIKKDSKKGVRGMAIKVLQANGPDKNDNGHTQDIILSTSPIFGSATGASQPNAVKLPLGNALDFIISLLVILFTAPLSAIAFARTWKKTPNVLEEMYYSGTPYLFGDKKAIKWHVRPLKTITSTMPRKPDRDFLRKQLIKDLKYYPKTISFALFVQFQTNKEKEPLDDATVEWKTPFHRVATITLPSQDIDTKERHEEDERISFSPGNAIPEHAPLGSINMVRKKVYEQLARERIKHQQQPAQPDHHNDASRILP